MKENLKLLALTSLFLSLVACGQAERNLGSVESESDSTQAAIIGGNTVVSSDPITKTTVGLVLTSAEGTAICTGTLVTANVVLTAAHCIQGVERAAVVFGTDIQKAARAGTYAAVTDAYADPTYSGAKDKDSHDLALLKFEGPLPTGYEAASLLEDSSLLSQGMDVVLAGYGASGEVNGKLTGSSILRKVTVSLTNPNFSSTEIYFDSRAGKGSCHGDSGGPAFATIKGQSYVIGVTSRTTDLKGGCHKDVIYTNVAASKEFIAKGINHIQSSQVK